MRKLKRGCLLLVLILFVPVSLQAKSLTQTQQKIVGGTTAVQGDWPWMVALSWSTFSASELFCGGSLINERWVLTAAHCLQQEGVVTSADSFAVFIGGSHLYNDPGQLRLVDRVIVHPGYDEVSSDNDLALLKLKTPVTNVETIALLPLATMDSLSVGTNTTVIGWGSTVGYSGYDANPPAPIYPDDLQQVTMPLVDNSVCNTNLGGSVNSNMICAGLDGGGVDSCQGDSGGPLMTQQSGQWYQVGVVSWGIGCASAGYYGVYTRISNYISWIEDQVFDLGASDVMFPPIVAGHSMRLSMEIVNNTVTTITIASKTFASGQDLSITNDQCSSLASGQHCQLEIIYSPTSAGALADSLMINSDSVSFPSIQAAITGEAVNETAVINSIVGNPEPVLSWGTGGDDSWQTSSTTGTEGTTSVVSGQNLQDIESSWLVAHVNLAAQRTLFFNWKVSSEKYFDGIELLLDGDVVSGMSGEIKWKQTSVTIPAGNHVLHWRYLKDAAYWDGDDSAWIDNLSWDTAAVMNVFGEAVTSDFVYTALSGASVATDNGLTAWSTSVTAPWVVVTDDFYVGGSSLSSPLLPDGESSAVRALVKSDHQKKISFDLKVSTEAMADTLSFFINGVKQFEVSGERDWQHYEYTVGKGTVELLWSYDKDGSGSVGADKAWIDNVKVEGASDSGGAIGIYGLFVLFFYAYMNRSRLKNRYN